MVQVTVCGMRYIDLNTDKLKILGIHFSYNEKLKAEKNVNKIVTDMQRVLKKMENEKACTRRKNCFF